MKLIAQNSVLINAAMRKQTDSLKVAEKWLAHDATKAIAPEDVQSAKNWVKINVQLNSTQLKNALKKIYISSWDFGETDAENEITSEIGFDWDLWEPGREDAARLVDAPRGLRTMLDRRGKTIKGLNDTTLDRIGSSLALSLSQGLGAEETANAIDYILDDPLRSMVIARTETADALVQANIATYRDADIAQIEWLVGDPCDICAENAGQIVDIGETFASGDQYPPAHPNCVCDVSPVVPFGREQEEQEEEEIELSISPDAIKEEGYKANAGMKAAAQRAIDWRAEGHKGGTQVGATRARQIVSGEAMSADTVKRMYSFFSRHEVDKKATGFNSGEEGYPSKGRVAWDLWGGNAGFTWSRQIVERLKRDESKSADSELNKYDEDQPRDERGRFGSGGSSIEPTTSSTDTPTSSVGKAKDLTKNVLRMGSKKDKELDAIKGKYDYKEQFEQNIKQEDEALHQIAEMQGFTGTPTRAEDWDEFNEMQQPTIIGGLLDGQPMLPDASRLSRGFQDGVDAEGNTVTAQFAKEEFMNGEYYAGKGSFGNGIYSTPNMQFATQYAQDKDPSNIVQFKIDPESKVASYNSLLQEMYNNSDRLPYSLNNVGRYAAAKGFDVVAIDSGANDNSQVTQIMVLNRSAVVLSPDYSSGDVEEL